MSKVIPFKSVLNSLSGKNVLIFCPGKNALQWLDRVTKFVADSGSVVFGCNKVNHLIHLDYHVFTNNAKYASYGRSSRASNLILGSHINQKHIKKHKPDSYIKVNYTDRDKTEALSYDVKHDVVRGYYRTSGNLSIMLAHLMGAKTINVAGMSGFLFEFDGNIHYYKNELTRTDFKTKKEWYRKYDVPILSCLDSMKKMDINFRLITPTFYERHFDGSVLGI